MSCGGVRLPSNSHVIIAGRRTSDGRLEQAGIKGPTYVSFRYIESIHERLRADPKLKRWHKEPKVQQEIENTLMDKADGM